MTACVICPRTLRPDEEAEGRYACTACTDRTTAILRELPIQARVLSTCLEPSGAPRTGSIHAHRSAQLPLREDALTLICGGTHNPGQQEDTDGVPITAVLAAWAIYAAQELGWHIDHHPADGHLIIQRWADPWPRHGLTVTGWCAWLTAYLPAAATRPWIAQLHAELAALVTRARRITRIHPWRHALGTPCPACSAYGLVERWGETHIGCEVCGERLTRAQYETHTARLTRTSLLLIAARTTAGEGLSTTP